MKIYITRHSLTTWNEEKRLQGWKNSDLTKQGLEDAKRLGNYLKNQSFDGIYSSPLKRAKETAQLIFPNKTIIEDDRLKEMNFGDYEGKFIDELKKEKDYVRSVGKSIDIKLYKAIDKQKEFTGILKENMEDQIVLTIEDQDITFEKKSIASARLSLDF